MLKKSRIYKVLLIVFILLFLYKLVDIGVYIKGRENAISEIGLHQTEKVKQSIDSVLKSIMNSTNELAQTISKNSGSKDRLIEIIENYRLKNELYSGISVAFEPYQFNNETKLFSQYYDKSKGVEIDISEIYNYTDRDLASSVWYSGVVDSKTPKWSNPYFSPLAKQLVVDYGVPILKKGNSGSRDVIGVVSITISLNSFSQYVNKIGLESSSYSFIMSNEFKLIAYPDVKRIYDSTMMKDFIVRVPEIYRVQKERLGNFKFISNYTHRETRLFFNYLDNTNWILCMIYADRDLLEDDDSVIKKVYQLSILFSLLLICWFIIILKVYTGNLRKLWIFSFLLSLILALNIILIWLINTVYDEHVLENNNEKIVNQTELARYLHSRNQELNKIGYPKSAEIPTGIVINHIDFNDSYNVSFLGEIWQKFNDTLKINHEINFVLPQKISNGIALRSELISKTHYEGYWLYRYIFTAILKFDFKYKNFPLDDRLLNIQLMYPNSNENRILVPDLDGYLVLNPAISPGVNNKIHLPSGRVYSAFFTFNELNFNSNLGDLNYRGPTNTSILEYNILVKRNITNIVISRIVPIFIIAMLIFLLLFTLHKENGELLEGSALSIIQTSGGLLFILIVAHIDLRKKIITPEIPYIENFYFVMYLLISLVVISILLYVKTDRFNFLEYKNNVITKIGYWPFLLFMIYLVSILHFY